MDSNIQDWTPAVIRKPKKKNDHKPQISKPASSIKTTYTEDGEEVSKLKFVSHEMAQFIIKARNDKDLKQSDVAKRANLDIKIVSEIEKGGCVYNANDVNKIAKALGVNIPRK
jgi:ribosome-binding protein aMBF1 (putative translation factor)